MNQVIRGPRGEYLAEIVDRGDLVSLYRTTSYLGFYKKSSNRTYNASGAFVGEGNVLMLLL